MKCVNHPNNDATAQCSVCKDLLCDECRVEVMGNKYICKTCEAKIKQSSAAPMPIGQTTPSPKDQFLSADTYGKSIRCWHCNKELNSSEVYKRTEYGQCYCEQCYNKLFDPTAAVSNGTSSLKDDEARRKAEQSKKGSTKISGSVIAAYLVISVLVVCIMYTAFSPHHKPGLTITEKANTTSSTTKKSYTTAKTYTTTKSYETEDPLSGLDYYGPNTYKVGTDIPADEYMVLQYYDNRSGYICVSSDSNGNDILDNAVFYNYHFIKVSSGQYFELSNAIALPASKYKIPNVDTSKLIEGMYRVGVDIPAGEYKVSASSSSRSGYYAIYNTASADRDIEDNELFSTSSYVTVTKGQYLELSSCTAALVD